MPEFTVYKHTSPSGKVYIGLTSQKNLNRRWDSGRGYLCNDHFHRAILKYGWDNIAHDVIASGLTKAEACELEREMIASYKANDPRHGYNAAPGGEHSEHTEATRRKIALANTGRRLSEESRRKISENRKGKGLKAIPEATRQKMRENHRGGAAAKRVRCVETGVVYESINDAARATGIHKRSISGCCRGAAHYLTGGGFHWQFTDN